MKAILPYLILFGQSCCVMASYQSCMNDYAKKEKELKEQGLKCKKESHKEHFEEQEDIMDKRHKREKEFLKSEKEKCLSGEHPKACQFGLTKKTKFEEKK